MNIGITHHPAVITLSGDSTTASEELTAVQDQIVATLTTEQLQYIAALQITNAVPVGVIECLGIYFVNDSLFQPFRVVELGLDLLAGSGEGGEHEEWTFVGERLGRPVGPVRKYECDE